MLTTPQIARLLGPLCEVPPDTGMLLALSMIPTILGAFIGMSINFSFMAAHPIIFSLLMFGVMLGLLAHLGALHGFLEGPIGFGGHWHQPDTWRKFAREPVLLGFGTVALGFAWAVGCGWCSVKQDGALRTLSSSLSPVLEGRSRSLVAPAVLGPAFTPVSRGGRPFLGCSALSIAVHGDSRCFRL